MDANSVFFDNISLSDVLRDVYANSRSKKSRIDELIQQLEELIHNVGDANLIVPLIRDYMDISVKNDDMLIKMASIMQKLISMNEKDSTGEYLISPEEKRQLLIEVEDLKKISSSKDIKLLADKIPANANK